VSKFKVKYTLKRRPASEIVGGWFPPDGVYSKAFFEKKMKLATKQQEEKKLRCKAEGLPYSRFGNYSHIK
jgi:hypothetical protein